MSTIYLTLTECLAKTLDEFRQWIFPPSVSCHAEICAWRGIVYYGYLVDSGCFDTLSTNKIGKSEIYESCKGVVSLAIRQYPQDAVALTYNFNGTVKYMHAYALTSDHRLLWCLLIKVRSWRPITNMVQAGDYAWCLSDRLCTVWLHGFWQIYAILLQELLIWLYHNANSRKLYSKKR